jgi:hypothetical protein
MITKSNLKDVSLTATPESINFCGAWPAAKTGLQLLEQLVKNPFLKTAIDMLIKIGDGLCAGNS